MSRDSLFVGFAALVVACSPQTASPPSPPAPIATTSTEPPPPNPVAPSVKETSGTLAPSSLAGSSGPTGQSEVSTLETFISSYVDAICDNIGPCCTQEGFGYDKAVCTAEALSFFPLPKEHITFDPELAPICLQKVQALFSGCVVDYESNLAAEARFACTGTLPSSIATKQPGEVCTDSSECAPPPTAKGLVYCDKICIRLTEGAIGDNCSTGSIRSICPPGSFCDGTCKAKLSSGAQCKFHYQCRNDLYCPAGGTSVCTAAVAVGASCANKWYVCGEDAYCDSSSHCQTKRSSGQSCDPVVQNCKSPLYCGDKGTCLDGYPLASLSLCEKAPPH